VFEKIVRINTMNKEYYVTVSEQMFGPNMQRNCRLSNETAAIAEPEHRQW